MIMTQGEQKKLRYGWTTGACATAATKAAGSALLGGDFPDPVTITLPRGQQPAFALATEELGENRAMAGIIKDAGDDPDVTHQAMIISTVTRHGRGGEIRFLAGPGVGTVTRPGLPVAVGEAAINPVPRQMMTEVIRELAGAHNDDSNFDIEISIPGGAEMARHTMNGRLGIKGGLSILGTTGIVVPYSCAAWIAAIHQGIDVARAAGLKHVAACTGSVSEKAVKAHYAFDDTALLDMGDFAGGTLKYLRKNPVERLTLAGGFGKISKLAQGHMDLHSGRSTVDKDWLAEQAAELGADAMLVGSMRQANTAMEILSLATSADLALAKKIAQEARLRCLAIADNMVDIEVIIYDRDGQLVGRADG